MGKSHGEEWIEKKQRLNSCTGSASLKRLRCLTSVWGWASTWVKLCKFIKNSWQLIHLRVANSIQICLLKVLLAPGVAHQLRMRTAPRVWQWHFWRMDIFDLLYSNNYSNNLLNIHISITNQSKSFQHVFGVCNGVGLPGLLQSEVFRSTCLITAQLRTTWWRHLARFDSADRVSA